MLRERLLKLAEEKQAAWQRQGKVVLTSLGGSSSSRNNSHSQQQQGGEGEEEGEEQVVSLQALGQWLSARPPFDVRTYVRGD